MALTDLLLPDIIQSSSPNWNERPTCSGHGGPLIDTVILHYTGMPTGAEALARLCSADAQVSAHYLVEENGDIHQLVAPEKRAWHAGVSSWQGRDNINDTSIGIELVNPGHDHGYRHFPEKQIERLMVLLGFLKEKFAVPVSRFLGHSDVAPGRKQDPGELFPWQHLAQHGFGVWASKYTNNATNIAKKSRVIPDIATLNKTLAAIGYSVLPDDPAGGLPDKMASQVTSKALTAFQRHWYPEKIDGQMDYGIQSVLLEIADKVSM